MQLLAAQMGTEAESKTQNIPIFESVEVKGTTVKLSKTPVEGTLTHIYVLNGDGSLGTPYAKGSDPAKEFAISGTTVTLPTEVTGGQVFLSYEYEGTATSVVNSANEFPKSGKFVMEVLGRDVCDATTEVYAMLVLPNAKLSASTEVSFDTESTQNFELNCNQSYCSATNELFTLLIPEA